GGADDWEELARTSTNREAQVTARGIAASIRATCGDLESACRLIEEALEIPEVSQADEFLSNDLPDLVRCACEAGNLELADRLVHIDEPRFPYAAHAQVAGRALVAERRGNCEEALAGFREAAERWEKFGIPLEVAHARLGEARCLIAVGRAAEAEASLVEAHEIFERLGAVAAIQQAESVQAELTAAKR
ncbi:MAG TPA: tetratricopeptide repeat protein, partial [Candidatus Limnocylindria bacterium]|nr:tetratricopeptide repeat protein [Candidatus Limnocylindria bacterium]